MRTVAAAAAAAAAVGKSAEITEKDCPAVADGVEAATGATGVLRVAVRVEVATAAARVAVARAAVERAAEMGSH